MNEKFVDKEHRMNSTKMLWHMERVHDYYKKGKKIAPLYIDMGATKKCVAKCIYCYGSFQNMTNEIIEREALINLFRDAPKIGIKGIGLIGDGEPTCNPAVYDAMDIGKKNGLDMAFSTNGILLDTDKKIECVLRNCTWMRFNLSCGTKERYKLIHGIDQFNRVEKNIKRMIQLRKEKNYKCEIGFQMVFVPNIMMQDVIDEAKLALELGVDYFLIKQCSLPTNDPKIMCQFDVNLYDNVNVEEVLKKVEAMSTDKTKIIVKWALMKQKGRKPYDRCLGIPFLLQISGNGKVYPCGHLFGKKNDKYLMGDLHKQSIKEIVESDRYWEVIKHMETEFDTHKDCQGCCRQDKVNEFLWDYRHPPRGLSFI